MADILRRLPVRASITSVLERFALPAGVDESGTLTSEGVPAAGEAYRNVRVLRRRLEYDERVTSEARLEG
jgi:hypothetical protein